MIRYCRLVMLVAACAGIVQAQQSSPSPQQMLQHAIGLHQSGDIEGAIREYRELLKLQPDSLQVRSNLGAALSKAGRYEEAIGEYQQALKSAPPDAAFYLRLNLALAYYKSFQIPQAVDLLAQLHTEQPENANSTMLLADCRLRMGDFAGVIDLLKPLEPAQPGNRAIAYMLGMALIRSGKIAEGQQRVDQILRDGESADGRFLLAMGMMMGGDLPAAVKAFGRAIELNPAVPSLQSFYGQALLATGDADGAAQAFRKELAANPNDYDSNFQLAAILAQGRNFSEAIPLLSRAMQVRPGSDEARLALASARAGKVEVRGSTGGVGIGTMAPDFMLPRGGGNDRIGLSQYRGRKPVVVVFGSYTCPKFRFDSRSLNKLHANYGDHVAFVLVYVREAHSKDQWESTINQREGIDLPTARTLGEKESHAEICVRQLRVQFPAVVDGMDGKVEAAYDAWPSRVYLVGRDGKVEFNSRLGELDFQVDRLDAAIQKSLGK